MHAQVNFCKVEKDGERRCKTIGEDFFLFCQKIKDKKAI
jgi:hypothetical protein